MNIQTVLFESTYFLTIRLSFFLVKEKQENAMLQQIVKESCINLGVHCVQRCSVVSASNILVSGVDKVGIEMED